MKIYETLPNVENSVVTIGSFDGLHLGHQKLISETQRLANKNGIEEYIISFHPHPRIVLQYNSDFRLLMTLGEKKNKLQELNVKNLVLLPFNQSLSQLSAEEFILEFIIKPLNPSQIVLGYDHKFGKDRRGSMDTFVDIKKKYGYSYEITRVDEIKNKTQNVSSTVIRNFIKNNEIAKANELLGDSYSITGTVIHGKQIGRTIGYPTANIQINNTNKLIPSKGVYTTKVKVQGKVYKAATSIGLNPTIDKTQDLSIESFLLDFDKDIYGSTITVYFEKFIREELEFKSLDKLKDAIKADVSIVRNES